MSQIEVVLVDIGNTRIKSVEVINSEFKPPVYWAHLSELDQSYEIDIPFIFSSVRKADLSVLKRKFLKVTYQTRLPIAIHYTTLQTLGVDRIAAAVGVHELFPNQNSVIIDLGTCMTIDFLDKDGVFHGGAISPGLKMRARAMNAFTDQLPDISQEWEAYRNDFPGKSTKESLFHGVFTGMLYEITGHIRNLETKFTTINVILTGGDRSFFESYLKPTIFAGFKIIETGLYRIWKYQ